MNGLRQTSCMAINQLLADNFAFFLLRCTTVSRASDVGYLNLFHKAGAWLSIMKTYLYIFYPIKSLFYAVKLEFAGV